jgi:hypothetical protein
MDPETTETATQETQEPSAFDHAFEQALAGRTEVPVKPEARAEEKTAAAETKTDDKTSRRAPDELFGGKKEEAKTEEKTTEDELKSEIPDAKDEDFKSESGKISFKKLRETAVQFEKEAKSLRAEKAKLEATLSTSETKALQDRLDAIQKERDEFSEIVAKSRVESHPDFKAKYVDGRQKLVEKAANIINESGGNADDVKIALNLTGKARVDALRESLSDLDAIQQGRIGKLIDQLDDLDAEREAKVDDSGKFFQEVEKQNAERTAKEEAEFNAALARSFTEAEKTVSELEVFKKVDGADWWNEKADAMRKAAREEFLNNGDPQAAAKAFLEAKAAHAYRDLYVEERKFAMQQTKELEDLKKELEGIHSRSHSLRGNKGASTATGGVSGWDAALKEAGIGA